MCISLFTSRLVLEALGIDNFGIYNVVGGFVSMFSIISGALSGSISRYITFGIGKGNLEELRNIFSTSINIQLLLSLIIIIVGESVGVWYVNYEMNLPQNRLYAANWVLQCSMITFVLGLLSTPYNACIIAHEKMSTFAYMTILDVVFKLLFVYTLFVTPFDKLITYAVSLLVIAIIIQSIYFTYCKRHFQECKYRFHIHKRHLKEMGGFAWWSFFGNTAYIFNTQGVNMAVNSYFGVVFNAARGVAGQVEAAILNLIGNFTVAMNPQITKSYAEGNKDYMFSLMCKGAKLSFFLFLILFIPVAFCADSLLSIWLKEVPDKASIFLILSLANNGVMMLGSPFLTGILATGNIRNYEIVITLSGCLVFPLSLLAYHYGAPVEASYLIFFVIYNILIWIRMIFVRNLLNFPIKRFTQKVMVPVITTTAISIIPPFLLNPYSGVGFGHIIIMIPFCLLSTSLIIFTIGLTSSERNMVKNKLLLKLCRFKPWKSQA